MRSLRPTSLSVFALALAFSSVGSSLAQGAAPTRADDELVARFDFDGDTDNAIDNSVRWSVAGPIAFVGGLRGQALGLTSGDVAGALSLARENLPFDRRSDFSVQFWVRTTAPPSARMVLLSQKAFPDHSLAAQKQAGWVFSMSAGTWAWNMGSGDRRLTYERDNGKHMPLNDGRWHQLTMTYDGELAQVRLYYDGDQKVVYNLADSTGFDFTSTQPLTIGWDGTGVSPQPEIVPAIHDGARTVQEMVDAFNALGAGDVAPEELVNLVVEPKRFFDEKVRERAEELGDRAAAFIESMRAVEFEPVSRAESALMRNPYTVHQAFSFMEVAPLLKLYSLVDGKVTIDRDVARSDSSREQLFPSDFDIDELAIWGRALRTDEVAASYAAHFKPVETALPARSTSITAGVWNIFHGGKHFTVREHGWDSRVAIAQLLERENIDVVMMQETYSSGDFIAAELGYDFATTVDWDYLNQGANISVLSRYPIQDVHVQEDSAFMNVAARVTISETQDVWIMSNWYGMGQFADVFEYHSDRFADANATPVLFAGDFNAIPHTDGGDSPASKALLDAGFTDAFRSAFPDLEKFPGPTHRSGRRIDQLYFKGSALDAVSTRVVDTWPSGFPSDHFLIVTRFELNEN